MIGSKGDGEVAAAQFEKLKKEDEELEKKVDIVVDVVKASFLERNVYLHDILSSLKILKSDEEKTRVKYVFGDILESQSLHVLFFTLDNSLLNCGEVDFWMNVLTKSPSLTLSQCFSKHSLYSLTMFLSLGLPSLSTRNSNNPGCK